MRPGTNVAATWARLQSDGEVVAEGEGNQADQQTGEGREFGRGSTLIVAAEADLFVEGTGEEAEGGGEERAARKNLQRGGEMELFDDSVGHVGAIAQRGEIDGEGEEILDSETAEAQPEVANKTLVEAETEFGEAGAAEKFLQKPSEEKDEEAEDEPQADLRDHVVEGQAEE